VSGLEELRRLEAAATAGPWFLDDDGISIYYVFHNGYALDRDRLAESSTPDAEFIVAARNQLPRILDALDAVLEVVDGFDAIFTGRGADDYTMRSATRVIRAAITKALEAEQ
jgi:hypothetical protein